MVGEVKGVDNRDDWDVSMITSEASVGGRGDGHRFFLLWVDFGRPVPVPRDSESAVPLKIFH